MIDQDAAAERAVAYFGGKVFRAADVLALFANTGIKTRRAVRPMDWYAEVASRGTSATRVYLDEAEALWIEAAELALRARGRGGEAMWARW